MKKQLSREAGYFLVEALVAVGLMAAATALVARVVLDARSLTDTAAARADLHQRSRIAVSALSTAITGAGAGAPSGTFAGPLVRYLPPVLAGRDVPGPQGAFAADAVGIISAIDSLPATLALPAASGATMLELSYDPGCSAPCGFADGTTALVFDGQGDFDLFTVTSSDAGVLNVRPTGLGTAAVYAGGAAAVPVDLRVYYLDRAARELRVWRAWRNDFALIDHVVDLEFKYVGEPRPPESPQPAAGTENCLYGSDGVLRPREALASQAGGLAQLTPAMLLDGPWCGSGSAPFDADLLRIRGINVAVRLEVTDAVLRGSIPGWFRYPGTAVNGSAMVRDLSARFDIRPLNLISWR